MADGHPVLGGLTDDRPVGLEAGGDEGLGSEAFHLLVDDRGQGDRARSEAAGSFKQDEGPGHGRQGALHVHGPPAEEAAVLDCGREEVHRSPSVWRDGVHMPAEEETRPRFLAGDRRQQVRPTLPDLDERRGDIVLPEIGFENADGGLFLPRHSRIARSPDHGL